MTLLEDITLQTKRLTYSDQLKLIAYLAEQLQLQQPALSTRRRWQEIAGSASYPLAGEDAQSWVSRSRQENDNEREKQYRSGGMKLDDALTSVSTLFLDTAPVIYYVEQNPAYFGMIYEIFERVDEGTITAVTSPITLSECLVFPYRHGNVQLQADFADLIIRGNHTQFVGIDEYIGEHAAELRARYNLALADALQFAVALAANCQAFLTNDKRLKRVSELRVLVVDELE